MSVRLSLALETGGFAVPAEGRIAVFHPHAEHDLSCLPKDQLVLIQPIRGEYDAFAAQGYDCRPELPDDMRFAAAVVFLSRAKAQSRMAVAQASALTDGPVLVDGAKTDGIDSILKELRKRMSPSEPVSKAHGKVFWFDGGGDALTDWLPPADGVVVEGFVTVPGVFSADGIDPASKLLVDALPAKLGRAVADLGAGWGYLSRQMLSHPEIEELHLVEANHDALSCARRNVADDRAQFHWADVRNWKAPGQMNAVVMNPPFHSGRSAEPELGKAFISSAAEMLTASGHLWMVANRHLPYEITLSERFAAVEEAAGDNRFKVLHASRPKRQRR
ncbi:class I SAM-dependent methyltransferase [Phaeobacter gallaeciensis]|uniref:class I SAM-dependent methyltransferase n=1 Tax=Phaeobacter gallaeciensis TaxID=60890 RepID=UPI00237F25E5|nr:class I SAM-dependent methyltransferase [Phaeobacter gallaeciensis]MDE4191420.1 class I SAM-dependent methyltransferase [Phaeobacter gallaeciensis]MDE4199883.1 class I SAM-dependent methyltransferase [Phaeobacter gallaeciensis]MDE4204033.1 class I SAM-dependent methyltransferase [Phaeobacter gallaeciensis]MDE4208175.1 class I SAM-dependent methyltransferase [Phaeobacter gallaeciensis]MDE4216576.1 class I SAM-dependent methyltransferase [Phaeobacter gallaeciensis]